MIVLRIAAMAFAALVATAAAAQDACIIYEHAGYRGESYGFSESGESRRYGRFWNDRVSSVRVAPGCRLTLFEHQQFRGDRVSFEGEIRYVGRRWNDRASSSVCQCERRDTRRPRDRDRDVVIGDGDPPRLSRRGIACIAYDGRRYRKAWRGFRDGEEDKRLGRRLRDKVSSVEVARGCVALLDVGRTYKVWVDENTERFPQALEDKAKSISCFCQ